MTPGCDHSSGPSRFDGDNGVFAGGDISQAEGAVKIALVAAKQLALGVWVPGDERDHDASHAFAVTLGDALYDASTAGERDGPFDGRTGADLQTVTFGGAAVADNLDHLVIVAGRRGQQVVFAWPAGFVGVFCAAPQRE